MFAKFKRLAGQSSLPTIGEVLRSSLSFLLLPIRMWLLSLAGCASELSHNRVIAAVCLVQARADGPVWMRRYEEIYQQMAALRQSVGW